MPALSCCKLMLSTLNDLIDLDSINMHKYLKIRNSEIPIR